MRRTYEIKSRPPELGGGWQLRLLRDKVEVGGGTFSLPRPAIGRIDAWWGSLSDAQRLHWIQQTGAEGPDAAYLAYLAAEQFADAKMAAFEWLVKSQ